MNTTLDLDAAVVVALGGNLAGDFPSPQALLEAALARFGAAGLPIVRQSSWWRADAWPDASKPEYRNAVVLVETKLGPQAALAALLAVEQAFGRRRQAPNASRTLDLDLIAHGRAVVDGPGLTLPHPRAHQRLFVMGPLAEIAPDWRHPVLHATAADLAAAAPVGRDAAPVV